MSASRVLNKCIVCNETLSPETTAVYIANVKLTKKSGWRELENNELRVLFLSSKKMAIHKECWQGFFFDELEKRKKNKDKKINRVDSIE